MRVGIIGDIHLPFAHPCYLRFCQDVFDAWQVEHVHFVGDVVDSHALGFWEHDPDGHSAAGEADLAAEQLIDWVEAFPTATVCIGNHDERHYRVAKKAGLPKRYLKTYLEVWHSPGWRWDMAHLIDGVLYEHGTGSSGKDAAYNRALAKRISLVMGHVHSFGGVKYSTNERDRIFGLNAGCGIDCEQYAFAYGKPFPTRPTLGCGIVIDGCQAFYEPMPCGHKEPYHRKRAAK